MTLFLLLQVCIFLRVISCLIVPYAPVLHVYAMHYLLVESIILEVSSGSGRLSLLFYFLNCFVK